MIKPTDKNTNFHLRVKKNTLYPRRNSKNRRETNETKRGENKVFPKKFMKGAIRAGFKGPYNTNVIGGSLLILYKGCPSDNSIA
jgi:hypothetical protein